MVYSEVTGHSKGYGFVEYMKKDFAAKARLELLGRQMGASALFAQWMDGNMINPASPQMHAGASPCIVHYGIKTMSNSEHSTVFKLRPDGGLNEVICL